MNDKEKTSVQISKGGLRRLNKLADMYRRSATQQIEWMVERDLAGLKAMGVTSIEELPHPADAPAVPLVTVCPHPPEAQQVVTHQRPNDGPDEGTQSLECTACGKVMS